MELKPGYKQTEVGVIPEEWDYHQLYELTRSDSPICYGIVQPGPYIESGIPVLAIKNLNTDYRTNVHRSSSGIEKQYIRSRILSGDVLLSVKGTTGRVGIVPEYFHGNISRDLARIRLSDENVPEFYFQMLQSDMAQRCLEIAVVGTTRSELSIGTLKKIKVVRPPKEEQQTIAAALSDVDSLIAALDKLIAKKRAIKTAAMQQLLTGKQRLPGFGGEWEVKQLGEIAEIYQPVTISAKAFKQDGYPVYGANGLVGFYDKYNHDLWQTTITCRGSTCGTVNRTVGKSWITGNAMVVNCDSNRDIDKLFLYFKLLTENFTTCITGTGQPQIVRTPLRVFEVEIPRDVKEQTAIATVFSDMDAEITGLEARRDKTKALKQGMMQELLTGRIRLV